MQGNTPESSDSRRRPSARSLFSVSARRDGLMRTLILSIVLLAVLGAFAGLATSNSQDIRTGGLIVTPVEGRIPGFEVLVGDHPVPGTRSFEAGRRLRTKYPVQACSATLGRLLPAVVRCL